MFGCDQCDQMTILFFNICSFTAMKMSPMAFKIYQSSFKIQPNAKKTLKILPKTADFAKIAKFGQIWSHCLQPPLALMLFLHVFQCTSKQAVFRIKIFTVSMFDLNPGNEAADILSRKNLRDWKMSRACFLNF